MAVHAPAIGAVMMISVALTVTLAAWDDSRC